MDIYVVALLVGLASMGATLAACLILLAFVPNS
jgi:hypothetical protein